MSRRTAAGALLVLALAGCGSSEPAAPALPMDALPSATSAAAAAEEPVEEGGEVPVEEGGEVPADPCALFTEDDARTLLRIPVLDGEAGPASCTYNTPPTGETGQAMVSFGPGAKKFYDIDVQLKHEFRQLPGIGDEAHAEDGAVFFRVGTLWVGISMVKLNDAAENRVPLETAAKTVAGRL